MENIDATSTVVIGLTAIVALMGGLFGMAVAIKTLFFVRIDPDKQFVTRSELSNAIGDLDDKIEAFKVDMTMQIKELYKYTTEYSHRMVDAMNAINVKLSVLTTTNEFVLGIKTPKMPIPQITVPDIIS